MQNRYFNNNFKTIEFRKQALAFATLESRNTYARFMTMCLGFFYYVFCYATYNSAKFRDFIPLFDPQLPSGWVSDGLPCFIHL